MNLATIPDVLTLEEAAVYLRLPPETILRQATQGNLPGRKVEDTWRFLKAAIDDWLRSHDSRTLLLQQAGALADDEFLAEMRAAIYQARERPEVDEDLSL
ncbi:MAG: helix-turn-helix domain-containing protein [Leptolyngbyaceae cyanobacterium RU_5_1]|nr:helix-turn-helix domain-containing protein [Leptolyngbyaceae cyanobacterium RU_5_1]